MQLEGTNKLSFLEQAKILFLPSHLQFSILDDTGTLLETSNSILDLSGYINQSVFEFSPFLESIYPELIKLKEGENLTYPRVEKVFPEEDKKIYEFYFYRFYPNEETALLVWVIESREEDYKHLSKIQQERNQLMIEKELLLKNKKT